MATRAGIRQRRVAAGRGAVALWLIIGLAACGAAPAGDGSPFVLTTSGDFVQSTAPREVEVTLGSKLIRPAGKPDGY